MVFDGGFYFCLIFFSLTIEFWQHLIKVSFTVQCTVMARHLSIIVVITDTSLVMDGLVRKHALSYLSIGL